MDIQAHLKAISEAHGPSGYEKSVREIVASAWQPLVDTLEVGKLGNLIGRKFGSSSGDEPRRTIMLAAHMDEIGMIVTEVFEGFLRFTSMNGVDFRTIIGKAVVVHGRQQLKGVVGARPLYTKTENTEYPKFRDLVVDLGLLPDEVAALVRPGDVITMDAPMLELSGGRVAGKAFDDRASVAAVTACLDFLQSRKHHWDVLAVATVQEEFGSHGARTAAFQLQPDIAIALDCTFATQPGVNEDAHKMGGGVPISLGANFHPALYEALCAAGERLELETLPDPLPADSGTDAWPIQVSRDGIPTALINIQVRNMHSTVETVEIKDIERAARLLAEFIAGLQPDFLTTVVWDKAEKEKSV